MSVPYRLISPLARGCTRTLVCRGGPEAEWASACSAGMDSVCRMPGGPGLALKVEKKRDTAAMPILALAAFSAACAAASAACSSAILAASTLLYGRDSTCSQRGHDDV